MFATRAEQYMEQQKHQWQQFGRQEGRQEERQAVLIKTLNKRFGSIPGLAISMIQHADLERLDVLLDCALEASSLEEWLIRVTQ